MPVVMHYVFTTIEGLHLTCDFVVHQAALFGCPPDYTPTRVMLHEAFGHPHAVLGAVHFDKYEALSGVTAIDEQSRSLMRLASSRKMQDYTCLAFELDEAEDELLAGSAEDDEFLLKRLIQRGERIVDVMRLFLFKPGGGQTLGRVGAIGNGVIGAWIGNEQEDFKFVARAVSAFQLAQRPVTVSIEDLRIIYTDEVFRELNAAACCAPERDDEVLSRVFAGLRGYRESRDIQTPETRFVRLATIAEHLAKKHESERLRGPELRDRVARIALKGWRAPEDAYAVACDLWTNVRNPMTHTLMRFEDLGREPSTTIAAMERLVVNMLEALVIAWRNEHFGIPVWDALLNS